MAAKRPIHVGRMRNRGNSSTTTSLRRIADQPIPEGEVEESEDDEQAGQAAQAGVSREDVDLVRVYLQHIGKRSLLKAHQEREIGERIETAQRKVARGDGRHPGRRADADRRSPIASARRAILPPN